MFAAILGLLPCQGNAADTQPVRGCYESWYPYYYSDRNHAVKGPVVDALQAIAAQTGITFEFQELPYKRCLEGARRDEVDLIILVSPNTPGLLQGNIPLAYWQLSAVVSVTSDVESFRSMDRFANKRVGRFIGYYYPDVIAQSRDSWQSDTRITYSDYTAASETRIFRLLELDRIDVTFVDAAWAAPLIQKHALKVKMLTPPVYSEANYIGYAPGATALKARIERMLRKLSEDGKLPHFYDPEITRNWPGS